MNWLRKLLGIPHECEYRKQDVVAHAYSGTIAGKAVGYIPVPKCIHCGKPLVYG